MNDVETIRRILHDADVWAIVGLSGNVGRPAYRVAAFLRDHGKRIVPVHPSAASVFGERGYARLSEIPFDVDCVDVFRRSQFAGAVADEAIAIHATAVWFQIGVVDHEAAARAAAAGLAVVMDRCPKIEWARLGLMSPAGNREWSRTAS